MYNEGLLVNKFVNETINSLCGIECEYDFEIILVNDGSTDNTLELMYSEYKRDPKHIAIIDLTRNFGLEGAVSAGLSVVRGDIVIVMDADLQDPPSLILKMVTEWEKGADIVVGVRTKRINDTFFKRIGANIFYRILDKLSGKVKIKRNAANFRLLNSKAVDVFRALPESNKVFRVLTSYIGMKSVYIDYTRDVRYAGKTKYNLKSMIPYALNSITGISVKPLRLIIYISIFLAFLSFLSFFFGIFSQEAINRCIFFVSAIVAFFFVLLTGCLAVIAEYIAQIIIEVKKRPTSIIYRYEKSINQNDRSEQE
jgi:dolichol-phosphate mannosyltransferase